MTTSTQRLSKTPGFVAPADRKVIQAQDYRNRARDAGTFKGYRTPRGGAPPPTLRELPAAPAPTQTRPGQAPPRGSEIPVPVPRPADNPPVAKTTSAYSTPRSDFDRKRELERSNKLVSQVKQLLKEDEEGEPRPGDSKPPQPPPPTQTDTNPNKGLTINLYIQDPNNPQDSKVVVADSRDKPIDAKVNYTKPKVKTLPDPKPKVNPLSDLSGSSIGVNDRGSSLRSSSRGLLTTPTIHRKSSSLSMDRHQSNLPPTGVPYTGNQATAQYPVGTQPANQYPHNAGNQPVRHYTHNGPVYGRAAVNGHGIDKAPPGADRGPDRHLPRIAGTSPQPLHRSDTFTRTPDLRERDRDRVPYQDRGRYEDRDYRGHDPHAQSQPRSMRPYDRRTPDNLKKFSAKHYIRDPHRSRQQPRGDDYSRDTDRHGNLPTIRQGNQFNNLGNQGRNAGTAPRHQEDMETQFLLRTKRKTGSLRSGTPLSLHSVSSASVYGEQKSRRRTKRVKVSVVQTDIDDGDINKPAAPDLAGNRPANHIATDMSPVPANKPGTTKALTKISDAGSQPDLKVIATHQDMAIQADDAAVPKQSSIGIQADADAEDVLGKGDHKTMSTQTDSMVRGTNHRRPVDGQSHLYHQVNKIIREEDVESGYNDSGFGNTSSMGTGSLPPHHLEDDGLYEETDIAEDELYFVYLRTEDGDIIGPMKLEIDRVDIGLPNPSTYAEGNINVLYMYC